VRGYAKRFAKAAGLPTDVVSDIALAAVLHDVGKADPRFQQWLHGGDEIAAALAKWPLAKSGMNPRDRAAIRRARKLAGYPKSARHEVQSLALIQRQDQLRAKANDWELVQHLVVADHGFGRPFVPPVSDREPVGVGVELGPLSLLGTSNHMMHRMDSGMAERYWQLTKRYGWWGLAWLETLKQS
jgi:CRISPR-associated endonuclease/helicase Cas3